MSLLSSFIARHLIPALESAFIEHEPEAQDLMLYEVRVISDHLVTWINSKVHAMPQIEAPIAQRHS